MDEAKRKLAVKEMKQRRSHFAPHTDKGLRYSYSTDFRDMKPSDVLRGIVANILLDEMYYADFMFDRDEEYGFRSVTVTMYYSKKPESDQNT